MNAISKLQNLLFLLLTENNDCTFSHIKAAIKRIIHPTNRLLVTEQMSLLTMKQHSTEQPCDFLVCINNQAALCELTKLAADPFQEITKLIFLVGLRDPDLKLNCWTTFRSKIRPQ